MGKGASAEKAVREIRRKTRRRFSAEEKIRILRIPNGIGARLAAAQGADPSLTKLPRSMLPAPQLQGCIHLVHIDLVESILIIENQQRPYGFTRPAAF